MLKVTKLFYHSILKNITFSLPSSGQVALLGCNGSGKTTLLKCLLQLIESQSEEMTWNKQNLKRFTRCELKKLFAFVPGSTAPQFPFSVKEMIQMATFNHTAQDQAISFMGVEKLLKRNILSLSSGERKRVYLARALAVDAPIILLDEPMQSLDPFNQDLIYNHLERLSTEKLLISATHDLAWASTIPFTLLLKKGVLIHQGKFHNDLLAFF